MKLTTTGTQNPVVVSSLQAADNNPLSLSHPTNDYDLDVFYTPEEVNGALDDIQALLDAGHITVKDDDDNPITDVTEAIELPGGVDLAQVATTGDFGDLINQPTTSGVPEGANLYYTDGRVAASPAMAALESDVEDIKAVASSAVQPNTAVQFSQVGIGQLPQAGCILATIDNTGADVCHEQVGNLGSAFVILRKARGTPAAKTALLSGDKIAGFAAAAYDGDSFNVNAEIGYFCTEDQSNTAEGAEIRMSVTNNGATSRTTSLTLKEDGTKDFHNFKGVNAADPTAAQDVATKTYVDSRPNKHIIAISGRFYCYTDNRWVGWSTTYGPSYYQWFQSGGTGATPNVIWNQIGLTLPAGTILKNLTVKGRANNAQITGLEAFMRAHEVDFSANAAIDSAGEVGATTILAPTNLNLDQGTGDMLDMRMQTVSLGDYTLANTTDIHLFVRPTGSLTATRFFYSTLLFEMELP